mgnify:FL=1
MLLVAITPEIITPHESERIQRLIAEGFDFVHLRKPGLSDAEMIRLIASLPGEIMPQITLGSHQHLASIAFPGGIHHNSRYQERFPMQLLRYSVSCHSLDELQKASCENYDYAFLSPIFDSISKAGYQAAFEHKILAETLPKTPIATVALGGVTAQNLAQVKELGFKGAAFLGYLFGATTDEEFSQRIKQIIKHK